MSDYNIVARPGHVNRALYDSIAETAVTGGAVRVPLDGKLFSTVQQRLRNAAWTRGYRLRVRKDGTDHLIAWAVAR